MGKKCYKMCTLYITSIYIFNSLNAFCSVLIRAGNTLPLKQPIMMSQIALNDVFYYFWAQKRDVTVKLFDSSERFVKWLCHKPMKPLLIYPRTS